MKIEALPTKAQRLVLAGLRNGETLHWCGTRGRLSRGAVSMLCLFNLTLLVPCFIAAYVVWQKTQSMACAFMVLLPVCIALLMIYRKVQAYGRTVYLLSNYRVAWLGSAFSLSLPLSQNMICRVVMKPEGYGDIVFFSPADDESAVFYNVPDVRAVVKKINDLSTGR